MKILLLGDPQTGKTTVFRTLFLINKDLIYKPTVEPNFRSLTIDYDFSMTIWDMPGNRDLYDFQGHVWFQETDIAIIFYSIIDKQSIFGIQYFFNELLQYNINIPVLIVANKIDLMDTPLGNEKLLAEGRNFATEVERVRKLSILPIIEGSATNSKFSFKIINKALSLYEEQHLSPLETHVKKTPSTSRELIYEQKISRLQKEFAILYSELEKKGIIFSNENISNIQNYIENDRILRETIDLLDNDAKMDVFKFMSEDLRWVENKHNFSYIFLYTSFKQLLTESSGIQSNEEWAKTITELFLKETDTLDRFRALEPELQTTILFNLVSGRFPIGNLGDQIYLKYRELIYSNST
ncbi:MAG: hypothetical protein HeimC3_28280 [Candidatus Heimdallarchaeota archaeon LC_3]|nr:MAG: hypothetical protein HeimC3_28280 [Candidatus Heimdallarchaeota archaeon LC_3]